jgi:excisionase family DNA binding protein
LNDEKKPENLLGVGELATRLSVSKPTVRTMLERGELEGYLIHGRWKVSERQLERYFIKVLNVGR